MLVGALPSLGVRPPTTNLPPGASAMPAALSPLPAMLVVAVPLVPKVESSNALSVDGHDGCVPPDDPGRAMIVPRMPTAKLLALSGDDVTPSRPRQMLDVCIAHVVPPFVVVSTVPVSPAMNPVVSSLAKSTSCRSFVTPDVWGSHVVPSSTLLRIVPLAPTA